MKTATLKSGHLILLFLALCPLANAGVIVTYSTANLGGGTFQYNFAINNASGTIPVSGLLIEGGNSVFGLGPSSAIGAPSGWGFISPLPPFDDLLSYFSMAPASNISIGGSLTGFSFQSTTAPGILTEVDTIVVGSDSSQTPYKIVPEPATITVVFLAAGAAILGSRFLKSTKPTSVSSDETDLAGENPHP
jgi:hypothetical protein